MISIVRARVEDASEILKVKICSFKDEVNLYGVGPPGYDSLESQIKSIKEKHYYKILDGEKIIGGMSIGDIGEGNYWIGSIYIDLEYQNRGIGSMAMSFLEDEFPQAVKMTLETPYLSFRNHHFYEKMGFKKVGETEPDENCIYLFKYEKVLKEI